MRSLLLVLLVLVSCQSAYYATMEKFGVHKRDILVDRVEEARGAQADAKEQFQSTYEAFQALTGFDGGELEKLYKKLENEYEDSEDAAGDVTERIASIESVAGALFDEWDGEIEQIQSASIKAKSASMKRDTVSRYDALLVTMREAEASMAPVLSAFKDHVLFLKHSLNAQAIASLREDALSIQGDVQALLAQMQSSIDEADAFIESMAAPE